MNVFCVTHAVAAPPQYRAEQAADGTFTVFDVPVFGELEKYAQCGNPEIDSAWLNGALKRFAAREAEGYLPPLHIKHHGYGEATQPAGHFRLTRVGRFVYEGKAQATLFADFVAIPAHVFERMKAGETPYRSVEVLDWDDCEIHSVALLTDEVPFFRYPNLRIGDVQMSPEVGSFRAYATHDGRPAYLFRLDGGFHVSTTTKKRQKAATTKPAGTFMETPDDEKPEGEMDAGGTDIDAIVERVLETVMAAVEQKIAEAISKAAGGDSEGGDGGDAGGDFAALSKKLDAIATQVTEQTGRIAAVEHWKGEQAEKAAVEARFAAAKAELSTYRLTAQDVSDLRRAAEQGDEECTRLAGVFKRTLSADPPTTFRAAVSRATQDGDEPECVAKFAAAGTDRHAAARRHWRSWQEVKRAAPDFATPLEKYLEIQMSTEQAQ